MVGRGLGGTGTVSGAGTVVVPGGRYWGDARQVVTTFFQGVGVTLVFLLVS